VGFLWEDSTGARAVKFLREHEQGFVIDSVPFATALGVKPGALHQLLDNALKLRFVKKVYGRGRCVGWKLGAAGDSVTIERRKARTPLSDAEIARRRAAREARRRETRRESVPEPVVYSGAAEPDATLLTLAWLGGTAPNGVRGALLPARGRSSRPASYLARWRVLYRDERGQVHGDVQVQAVHAELGVIDAWCETRGGVDRFSLSGLTRVVDADSGRPVDVQKWVGKPQRLRSCKLAGAEA